MVEGAILLKFERNCCLWSVKSKSIPRTFVGIVFVCWSFGQRKSLLIIYTKLFLNTIINGKSQTLLSHFFEERGGCTQAIPSRAWFECFGFVPGTFFILRSIRVRGHWLRKLQLLCTRCYLNIRLVSKLTTCCFWCDLLIDLGYERTWSLIFFSP